MYTSANTSKNHRVNTSKNRQLPTLPSSETASKHTSLPIFDPPQALDVREGELEGALLDTHAVDVTHEKHLPSVWQLARAAQLLNGHLHELFVRQEPVLGLQVVEVAAAAPRAEALEGQRVGQRQGVLELPEAPGLIIQYDTIRYDTIQYNTIQHNTTQHNTTQHNTTQYNTIQYNKPTSMAGGGFMVLVDVCDGACPGPRTDGIEPCECVCVLCTPYLRVANPASRSAGLIFQAMTGLGDLNLYSSDGIPPRIADASQKVLAPLKQSSKALHFRPDFRVLS